MGKTDEAWNKLFDKYKIADEVNKNGSYRISAQSIKAFREVRLMTKFDHSDDRPEIFKKNELSILPLNRSSFIIGRFDCYMPITDDPSIQPKYMPLPAELLSLTVETINSEQMALTAASASGIINDFLDDNQVNLTVEGRLSSGSFQFLIDDLALKKPVKLTVENSQMEIDSGYETASCLLLVEAKMFFEKDFLVRQLFYPYMKWSKTIKKPIRLAYLVYSDGLYKFFEFAPTGDYYNGLKFVRQVNYTIRNDSITNEDIKPLLYTPIVSEPSLPFPQADSFERVISMLSFFAASDTATPDQITSENSFVDRQTNYYTSAMMYLGLLEKTGGRKDPLYYLSAEGREIEKESLKQKDLDLAKRILEHKAFRTAYLEMIDSGSVPSKEKIVKIMKESHLYKIGKDSTYKRRSSTISSWISWIASLIKSQD